SRQPVDRLRQVVAMAALAAVFVFVVQDKPWSYQLFPFIFLCGLLIVLVPIGLDWNRWGVFLRLAVIPVLMLGVFPAGDESPQDQGLVAAVESRLRSQPGTFYFLSTSVFPAFPAAVDTDARWGSRFPCLIMLPGLVKGPPDPRMNGMEQDFRRAVV